MSQTDRYHRIRQGLSLVQIGANLSGALLTFFYFNNLHNGIFPTIAEEGEKSAEKVK
jgi:hypothetical protein